MNTTIFTLDENNIDKNIIKKASSCIRNGDLVAFPTETVYGLGANGLDSKACNKIFKAKGRPSDNPLILHISNIQMLYNLVTDVSYDASKLIEKFWPGPLTIIFNKSNIIPHEVSAGLDTVAIRFPKNKIAKALIENANTPIAAPSANISGRPSPTNANDVYFDMKGKIPIILDGGDSNIGIESTVIDMSTSEPIILRPGFFTLEDIKEILPNVKLDDALVNEDVTPKSPGQKYTHYAPNAKMKAYVGKNATDKMLDQAIKLKEEGLKVGILAFEDEIDLFKDFYSINMGSKNDLSFMSHIFYSSLRQMDKEGVDVILAHGVSENNLGKSIMNRMRKSASGNVYYIKEQI